MSDNDDNNYIFPTTFKLDKEIKQFQLEDYINRTKNGIVLEKVKPDDEDYDADDLLYTNAILDDTKGDNLDKSRYIQQIVSYINIVSPDNDYINKNIFKNESLYSTGYTYVNNYEFYLNNIGYVDDIYNIAEGNYKYIVFSVTNGMNIINVTASIDVHENISLFGTVVNTVDQRNMSEDDYIMTIQDEIQMALNSSIINNSNNQITSNIFTVSVTKNPNIEDKFTLITTISVIEPYKFICIFSFDSYISLNTIKFTNNDYTINLGKPYKNVKSLKLLSSNFRNTDTVINCYNNLIILKMLNVDTETETEYKYLVPIGNYSVDELLTEIVDGLNLIIFGELIISNYFSYSYNSNTGIIIIEGIDDMYQFNINMNIYINNNRYVSNSRTIWNMLGFIDNITLNDPINNGVIYYKLITNGITKYNKSGMEYTIPYHRPFLGISRNIWISLNDYETIYDVKTNKSYFNKLSFFNISNGNLSHNNIIGYNKLHIQDLIEDANFQDIVTIFPTPIAILDKIHIVLYDEIGTLYNTNNEPHWFILEIVHQVDKLVATDIQSRRDAFGGAKITVPML